MKVWAVLIIGYMTFVIKDILVEPTYGACQEGLHQGATLGHVLDMCSL